MIENNFSIANLLLCDNYTRRGKDAMSKLKTAFPSCEERLDPLGDIYCPPYFEKENEASESDDSIDESILDDYAFSRTATNITITKKSKKDFEISFLSKEADKILRIRGNSGSGKSSYLNHLKNEYGAIYEDIIDVDLEYAATKVIKGNREFRPPIEGKSNTPRATWLFVDRLLDVFFEKIWNLLIVIDPTTIIRDRFEACYGNEDYIDDYTNLFSTMTAVLRNRQDSENTVPIRKLKGELFSSVLKFLEDENGTYLPATIAIERILEVSTRMLYCLSSQKRISLICFDSIEHYIRTKKKIYDSDISDIVDSIYNFFDTESAEKRDADNKFRTYFKLLIVVRDTTDKMFSYSVHSYFTNIEGTVDVTSWFDIGDIYAEKLASIGRIFKDNSDVLAKIKSKTELFSVIAFSIDASANKKGVSLHKLLTDMYNDNKRRITQILSQVITHLSTLTSSDESALMTLEEFIEWWTANDAGKNRWAYRYLRRRAILRLIWEIIKNTGYFSYIEVFPNGRYSMVNTYTRRILNFLSSYTLEANGNDYYIDFYTLLKGIFNPLDSTECVITQREFINFSKVLMALNESRFDYDTGITDGASLDLTSMPNYWCQLIVIKFNDSELRSNLTLNGLASKLERAWNAGLITEEEEYDKYGIKITSAGRFFTYMQSTYEFFACRYSNPAPVIFIRDFDKIAVVFDEIFHRVSCLIEWIQQSELQLFGSKAHNASYGFHYNYKSYEGEDQKELTYPLRIIRNHYQYLLQLEQVVKDHNKRGKTYLKKGTDVNLLETIEMYKLKYLHLRKKLVDCGYLTPEDGV